MIFIRTKPNALKLAPQKSLPTFILSYKKKKKKIQMLHSCVSGIYILTHFRSLESLLLVFVFL